MPASVEPTRSLPAVVVSKSRKVEPCSLFWDTAGDVLLFGESGLSCSFSSLIGCSRANSLFSEINHFTKIQIKLSMLPKYRQNWHHIFYSELKPVAPVTNSINSPQHTPEDRLILQNGVKQFEYEKAFLNILDI